MDRDEQKNKSHKNRLVGSKAAKKDEFRKKKAGIELEANRGKNRKAFQGPTSGSRKGQGILRTLEKRETALHMPTMDKTLKHIASEPPLLVAVVGPPGVGKSTLIRSMVKFYSNRNLQNVRGPITVVAGRSRRVTFLECPNTLTAMCDVAKVADLILLMVDGSFGFEMETFEFLNISQVHGFPRMFGIVSHLDQLKTGKALKKRKKFLRHRFWHEVSAGAKLLCMAPMVRGMYRSTDVLKLHRLLICVEPKIQNWRNTHSCLLIDRHEDITSPQLIAEDENCNRTIAFYGYARGKPIKGQQLLHIPGLGDYPIAHISYQDDPCAFDGPKGTSQGHKMRHLSMKQKRLYAPYCDVSGVMYDDDAIYIQEDAEKELIERSGEGLQLLRELQRAKPMDAGAASLNVVRRPVHFRDEDAMELEMDEVEMPSSSSSSSSGDEDDDDNDTGVINAKKISHDLSLYGPNNGQSDGEDNENDDNNAAELEGALLPRASNAPDAVRENTVQVDWSPDSKMLRMVKNMFVTGNRGAVKGEGEEGENDGSDTVSEASKGYESEDDEFDAIVRGEKTVASPSMRSSGDSDSDGEGKEENTITVKKGLRTSRDALAGIGGGGNDGDDDGNGAWGAFRPPSTLNKTRQNNNHDDQSSEGYDILADEGNYDDNKDALSDEELDGLVSTFLAPRSGKGAQPNQEEKYTAENADGGIQFYDPSARHQQRSHAISDDNEDDKKEEEAVISGGQLTEEQERIMQKKMAKKAAFNEDYDMGDRNNTFSHYHHLTRSVEEKRERLNAALDEMGEDVAKKIQLVGYFSGLYVRFVLENVPVEFVRRFDPCVPLLAGGVNPGEDQFQIVQAKLKRHRWYPKILKAQDPLLLSMGWRRFQTQPIFATEDPNGRVRYLKYSPLHMHCTAAFYAPVAPTNTGFLAIPVREQRGEHFRISCTGYTTGNDSKTSIVKKLKLTGTPQKIMKTTAFIKGMFNSDIEATKFIGAKLKSVSGIRGIVKAVLKGKDGLIRASFEDKIFPSDIVFIRAWKNVLPPKYCSVQRNLVDGHWVGMRSMRELRLEHNVPLALPKDSEYREIKRRRADPDDRPNTDAAVKVLLSRNQKMQLPFDLKEEFIPLERSNALRERVAGATTVAPEPREMRRRALLNAFDDKTDAMQSKKAEAKKRARSKLRAKTAAEEQEYMRGLKKSKKETARLREFRSQHKSRK